MGDFSRPEQRKDFEKVLSGFELARNPYLFFRKIGDLTTPAVAVARSALSPAAVARSALSPAAVARSAVSSISYSTDSATFNSADNYDQYFYSDNGDNFDYDYNRDSDYKWSGGDGYWNSDYYGDYTYNDYTGY